MHDETRSTSTPHSVDNTDWLKTAAIILVSVDHIGYFFMENDLWWSVVGLVLRASVGTVAGKTDARARLLGYLKGCRHLVQASHRVDVKTS